MPPPRPPSPQARRRDLADAAAARREAAIAQRLALAEARQVYAADLMPGHVLVTLSGFDSAMWARVTWTARHRLGDQPGQVRVLGFATSIHPDPGRDLAWELHPLDPLWVTVDSDAQVRRRYGAPAPVVA
jgi:hypothetical protein